MIKFFFFGGEFLQVNRNPPEFSKMDLGAAATFSGFQLELKGGQMKAATAAAALQNATDRLTAAVNKQKAECLRGCDWLQEVSITVRQFRRSTVARDR